MPDRHFFCRALPSSAALQLYAAASQFVGLDRGTAVSLLPFAFFSLGACRVVLFKFRRNQQRAAYFSTPAIRSLRSIPFLSVLKAGSFSHAGSERAWQHSALPTGSIFL